MATILTLNFVSEPIENKFIAINAEISGVPTLPIGMDFVDQRLGKYESTAPSGEVLSVIASNFANAFNIDYSIYGSANANGNYVTITFINASAQVTSVSGTAIFDNNILYTVENDTPQLEKSVSLVGFSQDISNVCGACFADIEAEGGTESYNVYRAGYTGKLLDSVSSPFQISAIRGTTESFRITDTDDIEIGTISFTSPKRVSTKNLDFTVTNTLNSGSNITINVPYIDNSILPYLYSLNGTTYQSSNVFSGLTPSTYTVYIKDDFGCVSTKEIVVDGFTTVTDTIFSISEINALRFAKIEEGKKNHKNTLSCFELKKFTRPYFHKYLSNDTIKTQFKTNAQYINVNAVDSQGNSVVLPVVKATENIGLTKKSTCTYFDIGDGKSAIYFGEVDILDPLNDSYIETIDYGFTLPEWANQKGQFVEISDIGLVEIDKIGYSEFYESFILEFSVSYSGSEVEKTILSNYNLQPYEVYEFDTPMVALPEIFQVVIEVGTSASNIQYSYISEKIKRVSDSDKYFEIYYSDIENKGGMNYQTGIIHKLLLEGQFDYKGEQETQGYDGDANYFVTDNSVYDSQIFNFYRLSSEMAHKLRLVVAHSILVINGIGYKISEAPEIKGNVNNNLKSFSVTLKRSGEQFLTDEQEVINIGDEASKNSEIAAAIEASRGKALVLYTKTNG